MPPDTAKAVSALPLATKVSLLSGSDVWHTEPVPEIDLPAILMTDGPHGLRKQEEAGDHLGVSGSVPATCFPTAATLASSWDEELVHAVGAAVGREARAEGIAVVLGPGLNIKRHPTCGRNFEYFSEDPLLTGRMGAAMVGGIQSSGVGACLKHFAVNNQEAHRLVVDVVVDERTLREIYLAGFEWAVEHAGPWTVMAAYNSVNGTYCCDNHRLLTRILRDEWGFDGLVMSDWGATNDRAAGVHAGMDLEMPGSNGIFDGDVIRAVESGGLAEADVDTSCRRVVDLVRRAPAAPAPPADLDAHHLLARRAAAESSVVLANDGILPLAADRSVAVIGSFAMNPRFQGFGSSLVNPRRIDTALEAIRRRVAPGNSVTYAPGYDATTAADDEVLVLQACAVAAAADTVVLMAGLPGVYESEGFDRTDMRLPRQQERLIEQVCTANPRTVVTLSNGSPIGMPWVDAPAAILESYLGGQASGSALADVLFGDVEPAGRLAETFPIRQSDVPSEPWFPGEPRQVEYREGLAVGYRHYLSAGVPVRFPFGHGLGYTTFEYTDLQVTPDRIRAGDPVRVRLSVTNTGQRPGADVVQVYVHDGTGTVARPARELKGFAKVRLGPGEAATVEIGLDRRAFAFHDSDGWRVGAGGFRIEVGASSTDIRASATVHVDSDDTISEQARASATDPLIAASDEEFERRLGHPIPVPPPVRPFTRLTTVGELRASAPGRAIHASLHRYMRRRFLTMTSGDEAMAGMLAQALDEMPLRGVALFADGMVPWPVLDSLIDLLNGRVLAPATRALASAPRSVAKRMSGLFRR